MNQHIDPYDLLLQLNSRMGNLEKNTLELQTSLIKITTAFNDQTQVIQQLQNNQQALDQVIGSMMQELRHRDLNR
jgi:hypothetical protein